MARTQTAIDTADATGTIRAEAAEPNVMATTSGAEPTAGCTTATPALASGADRMRSWAVWTWPSRTSPSLKSSSRCAKPRRPTPNTSRSRSCSSNSTAGSAATTTSSPQQSPMCAPPTTPSPQVSTRRHSPSTRSWCLCLWRCRSRRGTSPRPRSWLTRAPSARRPGTPRLRRAPEETIDNG